VTAAACADAVGATGSPDRTPAVSTTAATKKHERSRAPRVVRTRTGGRPADGSRRDRPAAGWRREQSGSGKDRRQDFILSPFLTCAC
jgi:hypothetical protein